MGPLRKAGRSGRQGRDSACCGHWRRYRGSRDGVSAVFGSVPVGEDWSWAVLRMLEKQPAACTLGIVHDLATGTIALAGLDAERLLLTAETAPASGTSQNELNLFWGKGMPQKPGGPELQALERVIRMLCPAGRPARVLLAVPT